MEIKGERAFGMKGRGKRKIGYLVVVQRYKPQDKVHVFEIVSEVKTFDF